MKCEKTDCGSNVNGFCEKERDYKECAAFFGKLQSLVSCPYCLNDAEYFRGSNSQADAIYCMECPLGVEHSGMSFDALKQVWNGLPRATNENNEGRIALKETTDGH